MNQISFSTDNARAVVLAATNRPSDLDEAIIRPFSQAFEIGKPSRSDRIKILKVVLKGERIEDNIDFDRLAGLCEGYTGSDILEACKQTGFSALREYLQDEKKGETSQAPRPLSQSDLERALAESKRIKTPYISWNFQFGLFPQQIIFCFC